MADLRTDYTDDTQTPGEHAQAHNEVNEAVNGLAPRPFLLMGV